jgi:hypothetical protein
MAFGDNPIDESLRDGWHAFCEQVKAAGDHVFKDVSGASDGERTNAFRYLTQNLSQAFDIWLENRQTRYPTIHAFCGPTRKLGADNADCIYLQSWINDRDTYKISGNRGTARMFNIAVQGPWTGALHEPFGDAPVANVFGEELETDWDGNFVLWLSPEPHPGNWIESTPGIRKIFYRQYFDGWDEVPASYRIERVGGGDELPPAIAPVELLDSFSRAGQFVLDCTKDWPDTLWSRDAYYETPNAFIRHGGATFRAAGIAEEESEAIDARRGRLVLMMNWDIPLDHALVIELDAGSECFWQITACTVFGASLDFRHRQVNLTSGMTPVDGDGITRLVVSHADPGFANWIDTQEHTRGWMLFRDMLNRDAPELHTRLVPVADLETEIGAVATRITPGERSAQLARRRAAIMRRYPL